MAAKTTAPFMIDSHSGERWVLATSEDEAKAYVENYYSLDEPKLEPAGWFMNVGWDRDSYERKRDFVEATGCTNWWESCMPPEDGQPTKNRRQAWTVIL